MWKVWCVAREHCPKGNITFDVAKRDSDSNFMCGLLMPCQDKVCCRNPSTITEDFKPSLEEWCYPYEYIEDSALMDDFVILYPGWLADDFALRCSIAKPFTGPVYLHTEALCCAT